MRVLDERVVLDGPDPVESDFLPENCLFYAVVEGLPALTRA